MFAHITEFDPLQSKLCHISLHQMSYEPDVKKTVLYSSIVSISQKAICPVVLLA